MEAGQRALLPFLMVAVMFPALVALADSASPPDSSAETVSSISVPINPTPDPNQALSVFHIFTATWMNELRGASALQTVAANSGGRAVKRFGLTYSDEVKATGSAANPYVGLLHYTEELYECKDTAEKDCTLVDSTPVTEIFRYQKGAWIY